MEIARLALWCTLLLIVTKTSGQSPSVRSDVTINENGETVIHCWFSTGARPDTIWTKIASARGLASWAAPAALVDLRIGGAYELYFRPEQEKGRRGMEGNRIISYNVGRMMSYSGGLPDTWVVYAIEPAGANHQVHFHAIGTHPEWVSKCREQLPSVTSFIQKLADCLATGR